jgi:hypothetical protein
MSFLPPTPQGGLKKKYGFKVPASWRGFRGNLLRRHREKQRVKNIKLILLTGSIFFIY